MELALPTASFPSLISSLAIERLWDAPDFAGSAGLFLLAPPRLEKFQVPLEAFEQRDLRLVQHDPRHV